MMPAGVQCETYRRFSPAPGGTWLYFVHPAAEPSIMTALGIGQRDGPLTFCRVLCLAEWAYVMAMASTAPAGSEPPPRAGTGWPT